MNENTDAQDAGDQRRDLHVEVARALHIVESGGADDKSDWADVRQEKMRMARRLVATLERRGKVAVVETGGS